MRVDINLATRPYEDAGPLWLRWGGALAALGLLTLILLYSVFAGWAAARKDRSLIEQREQQIAARDEQKAKAEETLNLPANRGTRDRAQFLNDLFQRKSFSWTKVFRRPGAGDAAAAARGFDPSRQSRQPAENQAGRSRRISRSRARAGAQDGKFATLPADSNRSRSPARPARRRATTCNFDISALYVPDLADKIDDKKGATLMREVLDLRKKAKIAIAALLVVDIAAVVMLFSPLVGSERSRREQLDQLWQELQRKTHEAEPLKDVDKKIAVASQQIDDFYKTRLPAQDSAIYEELGKVAKQNGVNIGQIRSKAKDTDPVGLRPVEIQADFSGDYLQLVRFINALERDPLFFIIDSVELGGEQAGVVKLQLKLETYQKASG